MHQLNEENALFDLYKSGTEEGFRAFFNYFFRPIVYFSFKIVDNQEEAKDVAVKAITSGCERIADFHSLSELKAYIYTVARNASLNILRDNKSHDEKLKELASRLDNENSLENPNRLQEQTELLRLILMIVEELPTQCSKVCMLAFFKELTDAEIAESLRISINTVRNHKQKGREVLREKLARMDFSGYFVFLTWLSPAATAFFLKFEN